MMGNSVVKSVRNLAKKVEDIEACECAVDEKLLQIDLVSLEVDAVEKYFKLKGDTLKGREIIKVMRTAISLLLSKLK